jgi:hypothetical protein
MQLELVLGRPVLVVEEVEEAEPARSDLVPDVNVLGNGPLSLRRRDTTPATKASQLAGSELNVILDINRRAGQRNRQQTCTRLQLVLADHVSPDGRARAIPRSARC